MQDYLDDIVSGGPQKEEWLGSLSQVLRPFDERACFGKMSHLFKWLFHPIGSERGGSLYMVILHH